jgi:hypothetical protein
MFTTNIRYRVAPAAICLSLLVNALCVNGCRSKDGLQSLQILALFDGYRLMLVDDLPENTPIKEIKTSELRNNYKGDLVLIPGRVYLFHKITDMSNDSLALKVLPGRLSDAGATVTKAPEVVEDLIFVASGGSLFVIEFEKGGHHGTILNRSHMSQQPGQSWEELIVALQ